MVHYTLITNREFEQKVLTFLLSLGFNGKVQDLYLQINFIINQSPGTHDYLLSYNDENHKLFIRDDFWEVTGSEIELEEFCEFIKKSLPIDPVSPINVQWNPGDYYPIMGRPSHGKTFMVENPFLTRGIEFSPEGKITPILEDEDEPDWVGDAKRFAKYWDDIHIMPEKNYTKFEIQHYNPMRQITLENLDSITAQEVVVVFQDKRNSTSEKRSLFLLCTYVPRGIEQYEGYGFMTTSDPLSQTRIFTSDSKLKSIELALKAGHEIYVCEEITRIQFSNSAPKSLNQYIAEKTQQTPVSRIESYVLSLLKQHTEYLISELGLSQYPRKNYFDMTEKFINDKLK